MHLVSEVSDKVIRSPTETAGKGGQWGFLQNKVNRASKVAIPLDVYLRHPDLSTYPYDNGFIVYATPTDHFSGVVPPTLTIGKDYVVLYTSASQINSFPQLGTWNIFELRDKNDKPAITWTSAAKWRGEYYVRTKDGHKWNYGGGAIKAIGIRQDEYCS